MEGWGKFVPVQWVLESRVVRVGMVAVNQQGCCGGGEGN